MKHNLPMSLELDARQRAMLQDMGITVWLPKPVVAPPLPAATTAPPRAAPTRASRPVTTPAPEPSAAPAVRLPLWHPPCALYPQADPQAVPPELGACWLLLLESTMPDAPLSGDVGTLLDNMLRAMRLHRHPRVFAATLAAASSTQGQSLGQPLSQVLEAIQPSIVLALGRNAAHTALSRTEPLGALRQTCHSLDNGTPVVVSYDPAYLLRALPEAKAAAWADLCRALETVRATIAG